jgi:hypothetical protein
MYPDFTLYIMQFPDLDFLCNCMPLHQRYQGYSPIGLLTKAFFQAFIAVPMEDYTYVSI